LFCIHYLQEANNQSFTLAENGVKSANGLPKEVDLLLSLRNGIENAQSSPSTRVKKRAESKAKGKKRSVETVSKVNTSENGVRKPYQRPRKARNSPAAAVSDDEMDDELEACSDGDSDFKP
jgi:hypothetical protein